jgi:hypothetical protein
MPDNSSNRRPDYHRAPTTLYDLLDRVLRHQGELQGEVIQFQAGLRANTAALTNLQTDVAAILAALSQTIPPPQPGKIVLLRPTFTDLKTGEAVMAAYPLKTNVVAHFVVTETSPTGALVPVDPADVFTVVSSDTTHLQAVVDKNAAGQTTISVNWLAVTTPMLTGIGIAITDSAGNTADNAELFDQVAPAFVPSQIGLDIANVVETAQPTPPAG